MICSLTAVSVIFITVMAMRIVRQSDRVIPAMLIFLDLSLVGSTVFFAWSNYRVFAKPWPNPHS